MKVLLCWHLPIFPGRHQPSIFGTAELNFCVRDGNRCTLSVINTNFFVYYFNSKLILYNKSRKLFITYLISSSFRFFCSSYLSIFW